MIFLSVSPQRLPFSVLYHSYLCERHLQTDRNAKYSNHLQWRSRIKSGRDEVRLTLADGAVLCGTPAFCPSARATHRCVPRVICWHDVSVLVDQSPGEMSKDRQKNSVNRGACRSRWRMLMGLKSLVLRLLLFQQLKLFWPLLKWVDLKLPVIYLALGYPSECKQC